jgi:hypothetical protein
MRGSGTTFSYSRRDAYNGVYDQWRRVTTDDGRPNGDGEQTGDGDEQDAVVEVQPSLRTRNTSSKDGTVGYRKVCWPGAGYNVSGLDRNQQATSASDCHCMAVASRYYSLDAG